jgi:NADH:ubiquinone oxidoreductase subunit E
MNLKFSEDIGHIGEVLTEDEKKRGVLIQAFQMIQEEHNYLPEEALKLLSQNSSTSLQGARRLYGSARERHVMCGVLIRCSM